MFSGGAVFKPGSYDFSGVVPIQGGLFDGGWLGAINNKGGSYLGTYAHHGLGTIFSGINFGPETWTTGGKTTIPLGLLGLGFFRVL